MLLKSISLSQFCGFSKFKLELSEFTVLVGPNNGGKTTVLRAIEFALESFKDFVRGGNPHPNLQQVTGRGEWRWQLSRVANRLGYFDHVELYHGRHQGREASVTLCFSDAGSEILLRVACLANLNNVGIAVSLDGKPIYELQDDIRNSIANKLFELESRFIPPIGTLSPTEQELNWDQLQQQLSAGRSTVTWRNQLHWLNEGQPPDYFERLIRRVTAHIPGVVIHPPMRTRTNPANVLVTYNEQGVDHDISASGGGVRTLVSLSAAIELSNASILLFDEPDAHLHSAVQRQIAQFLSEQASDSRQVLIATHAPDVIEEVPVDSLVWVEKSNSVGKRCDHAGRTLVDLGAVSHAQAVQFVGSDTLLYLEGKSDRRVLTQLMNRLGKQALVNRSRVEVLRGFGDAKNLPGAVRLVTRLRAMKLAVAVLLDSDYTELRPQGSVREDDGVLVLRLPCKELENLLLLSPRTLCDAAQKAAEQRASAINQAPCFPTEQEIELKIGESTSASDVRAAIEDRDFSVGWRSMEAPATQAKLPKPRENSRHAGWTSTGAGAAVRVIWFFATSGGGCKPSHTRSA